MTRWPGHPGYYCKIKLCPMCKQGKGRCSCACHAAEDDEDEDGLGVATADELRGGPNTQP